MDEQELLKRLEKRAFQFDSFSAFYMHCGALHNPTENCEEKSCQNIGNSAREGKLCVISLVLVDLRHDRSMEKHGVFFDLCSILGIDCGFITVLSCVEQPK